MHKHNQRFHIIIYLKIHGSITSMQALEYFGCARLASRIHEIRKMLGYKKIVSEFVSKRGKTFVKYNYVA